MAIEIIKPGLQTTIQDLGREGWMHLGISRSGAMDTLSATLVNRMLGVPDTQAVLEMTQTGIELEAKEEIMIALSGAMMTFQLNNREISTGEVLTLKPGDQLRYQKTHSGFRCYMGFSQPIALTPFLGSYATQLNAGLGGYHGRALKKGDQLFFEKQRPHDAASAPLRQPGYLGHYQLRLTSAPESDQFSDAQLHNFSVATYKVTPELDRMGIRISGPDIRFDSYPHMTSRGLLPGAIQIPPDGRPIIAGKDAQTTGGYLRIGQIIQADMPVVGQLKPGDEVSFQFIELATAKRIYQEQQKLLT